MEFISATFPGRWSGRGGSLLRPDVTLLNLFFWGHVNSRPESFESKNKRSSFADNKKERFSKAHHYFSDTVF
jgi:hypothetical protein